MKVLVTGANGFIGKNLIVQLKEQKDFEVLPIDRKTAEDDLYQAITKADFICHLAGVNRPADITGFADNAELAKKLCREIQKIGRSIPIIFTSSAHVEHTNEEKRSEMLVKYGESKLAAEQTLLQYSKETSALIYIFRLPHVIGKWCRPN